MPTKKQTAGCQICGAKKKTLTTHGIDACSPCRTVIAAAIDNPEIIVKAWNLFQNEPIRPQSTQMSATEEPIGLPDVVDGKRYRTVDRDNNKWYLSVSEIEGNPVEVFASTAFDRNHELQSRISNLTTITRLISLILRHIFLHEPLTMAKCLKQIQRSSRQKNDLPDMLFGVLSRYNNEHKDSENNPYTV